MIIIRVEKNSNLGRRPKNFYKSLPNDLWRPVNGKWKRWGQKNLTDDENGPLAEGEEGEVADLKVYNRTKAEYVLSKNEDYEPILPERAPLIKDLDEMKHLFRTFIKIHYRELTSKLQ